MRNFGKINNDTARHRTMSIFQDKAKDNSDDAQLIMELRSPQTCRAAFGRVIAMYTEPLYRQIRMGIGQIGRFLGILRGTGRQVGQNRSGCGRAMADHGHRTQSPRHRP